MNSLNNMKPEYEIFRDLFLSLPDVYIFALDTELNYLAYNGKHLTAMKELYGADIEVGRNMPGFVKNETSRSLIRNFLERALEGEPYSEIIRVPEKDTWYDTFFTPVLRKGKICAISVIVREISEIIREENKLHTTEGIFKLFIKHVPAAIAMFDREMRYLAFSDRYLKDYLGMDTDIIGKSHYELFPDLPEKFRNAHQMGLQGFSLKEEEDEYRNADGTLDWITWEVHPWYNSRNEVGGILLFTELVTKFKQHQLQLEKSEQQLRSTLDHMIEGCQILDNDMQYIYLNKAAEIHNRKASAELLGKKYLDVWPGIEDTEVYACIFDTLTKRIPYNLEYRLFFPDGDSGWFELSIQPVPEGVFIRSVDITLKKNAESARYESETKFRAFFENSMDASLITAPDGEILVVNQAACELFGYTADEFAAKKRPDLIDSSDPGLPDLLHQREINGKASGELTFVRKNGDRFRAEIMSSIFRDGLGNQRTSMIIRDITKKLQAESALRLSEEKFIKAFRNSPDAIILTSVRDGKIIEVNGSFTLLSGFSRKDVLGKTTDQIRLWSNPQDREKYVEILRKKGRIRDFESSFRTSTGEVRPASVAAEILEISGEPHILGTFRDITEQKRNEEAILKLNENLEKMVDERTAELMNAVKELEAFSYSVSHDLRAPIRAIDGFTRILLDRLSGQLDDEGLRLGEIIRSNTAKMGLLIDDLLRFSRLGRSEMNEVRVDMNLMVTSIVEELKENGKKQDITVLIHDLPPAVCDPVLMRQVWTNLISNAFKYSQNKTRPEIEIDGNENDDRKEYSIRDNGVGFNMDYYDKLFGVFQRLHSPRDFEGTGVGLAIVKRIIERHSGKVWAESVENKGATFFFSLPKYRKER